MMTNSTFKKSEYEKEKKVVIEEMIKSNDNPEEVINDISDKMVFAGTSYEDPIDTLEYHRNNALPYDTVMEMYRGFYRPSRFVMSIVSHIPFTKIKDCIRDSFFMHVPPCSTVYDPSRFFVKNILNPQSAIQYRIEKKKGVHATYLRITFRTCNHSSPDRHILALLASLVGGPTSSRMFSILRGENGLTYTSSCLYNNYEGCGEFGFYTMANSDKMIKNGSKPGVLPLIMKLIHDLNVNGVTDDEIHHTKGYLRGMLTMNLEDASVQCRYNGDHMIVHRKEPILYDQQYEKLYSRITKSEIHRVIRQYFIPKNMSIVLLGENVPSLEKVKKVVE